MGSKQVGKDSIQKRDKQSGHNEGKRNGQDFLDELQRKSSDRCHDRPPQRFENTRSRSPRRIRWSPPRRRSRSPRSHRSPRRMSRSPIRNNRPLRRISRSPGGFSRSSGRRFSRSPRRGSRSPRRIGISPELSFSLTNRSLSPFRRRSSRSPLDDRRRHNVSEVYLRSRSPSVEILNDSRKNIMTMKANVVETGLAPLGTETNSDLMTKCQTKSSSNESSKTLEINKERKTNESRKNKGNRSPTRSSTNVKYSPPRKVISPEPKKYRNVLEEIEDTFASKEVPLQKIDVVDTSLGSVEQESTNVREKNVQVTNDQASSLRPNPVNIATTLQHTTQVVSRIPALPVTQRESSVGAVLQNKDDTIMTPKLLGDAKKSTGDNAQLNLNLTDNRKTIQNKISVISHCQNAIKLLSRDRKDGRFRIKEPSENREEIIDLKGISPLKQIHIVRFQYTSKSRAAQSDDTSILINKLLSKVTKEPVTGCEVIDLCESPANTSQEKQNPPTCESLMALNTMEVQKSPQPKELVPKIEANLTQKIAVDVVSIAIQTEDSPCDECQKRKHILRDNMYTQTNEMLCFDVGCQINVNEVCPKSPTAILQSHSITQFTPAQLLQQRKQSVMSERFNLSPILIDHENFKKPRFSGPFSQDIEKRIQDDRSYTGSSLGSKRPGASAFFDVDLCGNRSAESNRYENATSSESKLFSRDRPQISRPLLGKSLPFSNFDPKLNFDASFGRWTKKY